MNGLYIIGTDLVKFPSYGGVRKKISGQIDAFRNLGVNMDYIDLNDSKIIKNKNEILLDLSKYKKNTIINYKFYIALMKLNIIDIDNYNFIYLRFAFGNFGCYKLIKYLKSRGVKVFLEIPTYPYYEEIEKNIINNVLTVIDKYTWKKYKKYIYRVVLTNDLKILNGIQAVNIINSININSIPLVKKDCNDKKCVNLVTVANISKWHGYDRIIKGIAEYNNKKDNIEVNFFIIGDGEEKKELEILSKRMNVERNVKFLGLKFGEELNNLFNNMDIGISSLALFRAGGGHDPIKSKEYIGRGLPVVIGYNDRAFKEELDFVINVEPNNNPINIQELIEKFKNIKSTSRDIRIYAKENLTWESQMKKILSCI